MPHKSCFPATEVSIIFTPRSGGERSLRYLCDSSVPFLPWGHGTVTPALLCKQDVQRKGKDQRLKRDSLASHSVRRVWGDWVLGEGHLQLFITTFCLHKPPLALRFASRLHLLLWFLFWFLSPLMIHSLLSCRWTQMLHWYEPWALVSSVWVRMWPCRDTALSWRTNRDRV